MACIPGERQLITLQQIGGQGPGAAQGIQLNRELTAAGLNRRGAPEGKQVLLNPPIRHPQQRLNAMPQLLSSVGGTVLGQLQQIPALPGPAPDHRSVVVVHPTTIAVGGCFGMGHHPLNRDLLRAPAPAAGNGSGLGAEAVELGLRWGLCPWIGHTAHAGTGQRDAVAVAAIQRSNDLLRLTQARGGGPIDLLGCSTERAGD